jgi:DtxR family transcriptional regulator, Mn-dependent transcriptional regulator
MYTLAEENYLKAIYALWEKSQESVNTNAIADKLQTKAASVTDMVKKLSDKRMLKYEKYKGVMLTDKGMKIAVSVVRKHRLWEVFLHEKLKFGWDEVHEIAEQLEHIDSPLLIDRLEEFLGFPAFDPHGDVIPGKNGEVKVSNFQVLSEVKVGANVIMSGVVDHSPSFLQYLDKLDLSLGVIFQLVEKEMYDGSLVIKLNNKLLQLSKEVARNILVRIK